MRSLLRIAIIPISSLGFAAVQLPSAAAAKHLRTSVATGDLRTSMRKLWEDHIEYTRNYIISALADLDAVAKRLLKNQDDIGNAIASYYGGEAGKKLSSLLRDQS